MIYCTNDECVNYIELEKPVYFKFTKNYFALGDNLIKGRCMIIPEISFDQYIDLNFKIAQSLCLHYVGKCMVIECLHNNSFVCTRNEILIDKSLISGKFICKCFSNRGISGHVDWFKNLNSDGTPKGGRIPD